MSARLVCISGASGSGKSTLAAALKDHYEKAGKRVALFGADRYFRPVLPRMISPSDGKEYPDWNHPDSFDAAALLADLIAARDGGEYDLIFFEGVTVLCHESLRHTADAKIWVDASIETRIYRRIARNVAVRGLSVEEVGDYYLRCARYREKTYSLPSRVYADFTVNNEYGFDTEETAARLDRIIAA